MSNKTILVVDDSSTIRKIIQRELSKVDYEVMPARNGQEALNMLQWMDPLPDLITLDIDMPQMNGFEVCAKIREGESSDDDRQREIAKIPIIFVSANDSLENREKGYELGVIDFIGKPFSPGRMIEAIENVLNSQEQFTDMKALIVEDSPFVRRVVDNILKRHGVKNFLVSNGEDALEVIKEENFDLDIIITDYIMPGMSGEELCRTLRSLDKLEQVPIFFISSIANKEEVLGFFKAGASDYLPKPFIEEEFRARIVTHLRNRKYIKELEQLNYKLKFNSEHDQLTSLHNRRFFQRKLGGCFVQYQQTEGELSCMLIDLDYFKQVNDNYGHMFGDLVLSQFAEILRRDERSLDTTARFGGEEFVILLEDTSLKECIEIAQKLHKNTEGHIYKDGEIELQVTASIGISSLKSHEPVNSDKLISMADEALYQAKKNGRNQIAVYQK